ncbi:MAG: GNAT family N-acetyltransferase [Paludibacteraceae bacterium]|nr:GNAT family N-acetyltransferase [Paludibacteraceae bacterium]
MQPIIPPVDTVLLEQELEGHLLRPSNKADNLIYDITAHECPNVMREIGRLREISYRDGGGATGKEADIDEMDTMDRPYHQLIVWDPSNKQIVGGYRYLTGDEVVIRNGQPFITSAYLFRYSERFIRDYLPYAIEFGRAFVQPMYQKREMGVKALFALDNIWDGIGAVMYHHPTVRYMLGKVTIYPDYNPVARELIYTYLERYHRGEEDLFSPYTPQPIEPLAEDPFKGNDPQENYHILQHAVREQGVVIPPMFSAYLNLTNNLQFFGTAIEATFSNVYDSGIMVDMKDVYPEKIERYIKPYIEWLQSQNK